ncbi:MAG: ATP synthase subunit C [Firmicutes bacterium]|nr:ATP synthase subunit C [Bacillota bacterium]
MGIVVVLAGLVCMTIGVGIFYYYQPSIEAGKKKLKWLLSANALSFMALMVMATIQAFTGLAFSEAAQTTAEVTSQSASGLGYIAAALSTGMATIGAGYAVGSVGSSALGAVSENPKILGKTLIFVGLAEGIAIYGLIISILILGNL